MASRKGKGADWVEKALGWTAEIVRRPPKVAPQEVMKAWAARNGHAPTAD